MLNYACWTIIFKALIFNLLYYNLSVLHFMLKGGWSANEISFKSHLGPFRGGICIVRASKTNYKEKYWLLCLTLGCLCLCLLADDTKIALHLRDNQGESTSSSALPLTRDSLSASCFLFWRIGPRLLFVAQSADKSRPDYNALLSSVGCSHRLVSGPVLGRVEAAFPKSCTLYHFILVTKAMYSRSLCVIFVF